MTSSSLTTRLSLDAPFQASKWRKYPVLLDLDEMRDLITLLGEFWIVPISGLVSLGDEIINHERFLEHYAVYISALKQGRLPDETDLRLYFSTAWTNTLDALYAVVVKSNQVLVRVAQPVIQLQMHKFDYSQHDETFRSMIFGESIHWGIQFSFPSLFQDKDLQVFRVREGLQFPNASLFKILQRWLRLNTIATPFKVENKVVNVPMRLGKTCLTWINAHPQFSQKGLSVLVD